MLETFLLTLLANLTTAIAGYIQSVRILHVSVASIWSASTSSLLCLQVKMHSPVKNVVNTLLQSTDFMPVFSETSHIQLFIFCIKMLQKQADWLSSVLFSICLFAISCHRERKRALMTDDMCSFSFWLREFASAPVKSTQSALEVPADFLKCKRKIQLVFLFAILKSSYHTSPDKHVHLG